MKLSPSQQTFLRSLCHDEKSFAVLLEFLAMLPQPQTSLEMLDDLVTSAPGMLCRFTLDADGAAVRYEYISPNCREMIGIEAAQVIQHPYRLTDLLHPDDAPDYWLTARRCAATLHPFIWEGRMMVNGEVRWQRLEARPKQYPEGGVIWNGIQTDTTLYREIEQVLRMSDERYRIIAEALIDYAFAVRIDDDGTAHLDWIIGSYEANTGYSLDEIRIMKPYDLVYPDDRDRLAADVARVLQGETVRSEYRLLSKHGQQRWIRTQHIPVTDAASGRITYYYCVAQDITEQRQSADMLRHQTVLETELNKEIELSLLKSKMMTRISHEFRTPLAVIGTSIDMLENYAERMNEEQRQQRFRNIHDQITRITLMLDEIAFIVRGQDARLTLNPVPLDLNQVTQQAVNMVSKGVGGWHHFSLVLANQPLTLTGDEKLLNNVVMALLMNAVKYSPVGSQINVMTQQHPESGHRLIEVEDEGIGIPQQDQERIFQPFFRASNIGEIPGMGLGLTAAREVVRAHGGWLTFKSDQGQGARFTVALPAPGSHEGR